MDQSGALYRDLVAPRNPDAPGQPYGAPHCGNTQYPWDGHEKLHPGQIPQDYNPIGED